MHIGLNKIYVACFMCALIRFVEKSRQGYSQIRRPCLNDSLQIREYIQITRNSYSETKFPGKRNDFAEMLVQARFAPVVEIHKDLLVRVFGRDLVQDRLVDA